MTETEGHDRGASPLLETKLFAPNLRRSLVARPRLIERLDRGAERKLTLVSAPAGFGKTTLLSEWLSSAMTSQRATGWLSLDERDNDPALFWAYFIAALKKIDIEIGESSLSLLRTTSRSSVEVALTTLINEISGVDREFTLVLDDYHSIEAEPIHEAIGFLIDNLPPQMHIALISREDPQLPLSLMRGRGDLVELRASGLRFTSTEIVAFLGDVMGLQLSESDISELETRTEGWIAGLQLAALSMQGRDDVSGFIKAFAGHNRYVLEYLAEEVLNRQHDDVRDFLLQTSVLDRLSGSLCDAVTGSQQSGKMLAKLERGNFFVIPLDDTREWYRYHHLFSDVLQARLSDESPELVPSLHKRASDWFERNGFLPDAIRHSLAAKDFSKAADLVDLAWNGVLRSNEEATWLGWLNSLPDSEIRVRPVLVLGHAWVLLFSGEFESGATRLKDAEELLRRADSNRGADIKVADQEGYSKLPGIIASARSFYSQGIGDSAATFEYARRALELLPEDSHFERIIPTMTVGLAQLQNGDLDDAYDSMIDSIEQIRKSGDELTSLAGTMMLAEVRITQGRIRDAVTIYQRSIRAFDDYKGSLPRGKADLYLGLTEAVLEQGNIEDAKRYFAESAALGEQAAWEAYEAHSRVVSAKLQEFVGDLDGALEMYEEAERVSTPSIMPDIRPVSAHRARIWITQGKVSDAARWADDRNLSVDDELTFLREFEHITLVMVLIARFNEDRSEQLLLDAVGFLDRLLEAAVKGGRNGPVVEILVQQALAEASRGEFDRAMVPLGRALKLGEPESYVRVFLAGGENMRNLLHKARDAELSVPFTGRLLSLFDGAIDGKSNQTDAPTTSLPDALTAREVEILGLVAVGLTNQELADRLFISLSTVKRHIANIYSKLGSSNRTQAVKLADELNLL